MFVKLAINAFRLLFYCAVALTSAPAVSVSADDSPAAWSSSDPLSIPYEVRINHFGKGNLAPNPSFERKNLPAGEIAPEGWEKVGNRVEWVDGESGAAEDDVPHGSRAVKIHRKNACELDEAEGVISDFIPVIPGNYELTYDIRLKNVDSNRRRWGSRLGDTVTVRVFFSMLKKSPWIQPPRIRPAGISSTPLTKAMLLPTTGRSANFRGPQCAPAPTTTRSRKATSPTEPVTCVSSLA